jgi:hypothetical protein
MDLGAELRQRLLLYQHDIPVCRQNKLRMLIKDRSNDIIPIWIKQICITDRR